MFPVIINTKSVFQNKKIYGIIFEYYEILNGEFVSAK